MKCNFRGTFGALLCVLLLVGATTLAFGQGIVTGSLSGTVEDQQQAVVPNAKITAVQVGTNLQFTATTNETGFFTIQALPVGQYTVTIEAPTFAKLSISGVTVNSGITRSLGTQVLKAGTTETVTVEGAAPLVQTDTVQLSGTYETKQAADLPIGNGFDQLALYTPGVVSAGSEGFGNNNGADLAVNGQRSRSNNFQIDGQANNDNGVSGPSIFFGNQDAIQEVQVLTNYDAQYGRNMGSVVNYVTKSGSNSFHGTAYEVYDGNWASSMANEEKSQLFGFCGSTPTPGCVTPSVPRLVDNRFGGTIGGPIKKDKVWFFGSLNFERVRQGSAPASSGPALTPTANGISQLQAAFPGNAAVAALAAVGPTAITAGTTSFSNLQNITVSDGATSVPVEFGQITRSIPSLFNDYEATGRVDWQISNKDRFFGRYVFQQSINTVVTADGAAGIAAGNFVDLPARDQQIGLDWVRTWTDHFLNQVRFSYSRAGFGFEGGSAFPNCTRANILAGCPTSVNFLSGTDLSFGLDAVFPQGRLINVSQWQDNASWVHGRHTFKFGGEYDRQRSPNVFLPGINGALFYAANPALPGATAFDNFLQNASLALIQANGTASFNFKEQDFALYLQDDWRIRDNFTLTLGVRYEYATQAINLLHDLTVARESNPATAFFDPTLPLDRRTVPLVPTDTNNFGPVVGFAYTPRIWKGLFGDNKTVIRGGFRIAYDPAFYNIFLNVADAAPTSLSTTAFFVGNLPASGGGQDTRNANLVFLPTGIDPGLLSQVTVAPQFHSPYSQQWNFGVQREIGSKVVAEVRYVGNHTVGNFQSGNGNPAVALYPAAVVPAGLTACSTPGTPGFGVYLNCNQTNVIERTNGAFSIYHSLQSRLDFRNWHGVTGGVSYTYSHTIDNASEVFGSISGGNTLSFAQNPFNTSSAERANSGLDFPHVLTVYMLYDLPFFKGQSGLKGRLLGGWEINPVYRYTSGQPYTVIQTLDTPGTSQCDPTGTLSATFDACRPILSNPTAAIDSVGICTNPAAPDCGIQNFFTGVPVSMQSVHWIVNNLKASQFFGTPFAGAGRNLQRGDSINNVSLSVLKNFKVTERLNLELRAVAFNLFNRQFRGVPDPVVNDGNFADANGSFGNTFFNSSGGDSSNRTQAGIGRRQLEVGVKIIF